MDKRKVKFIVVVLCLIVVVVVLLRKRNSATEMSHLGDTDKPITSESVSTPVKGRYVRLDRSPGAGYLNISGLFAFDIDGKPLAVEKVWVSNGGNKEWPDSNLIDGDRNTFVHTTGLASDYIEIELQSEQNIARIDVWNRTENWDAVKDRIVNSTVVVYDQHRKEQARYTIKQVAKEYRLLIQRDGLITDTTTY